MALEHGLYHPLQHRFAEFVRYAHSTGLPLAKPGELSHLPGVVVTGSGPSLTRYGVLADIKEQVKRGWGVVACKESIRILKERGIPVHYAVATDPKPDQIAKTMFDPSIRYLFATIVNPVFLDHFRNLGANITLFLTQTGIREEGHPEDILNGSGDHRLYAELWGTEGNFITEGGVSVANRALSLVDAMGARQIIAAGMDFGWRGDEYYARGATQPAGNYGKVWTDHGRLDGVPWFSKHDQLLCAEHLARALIARRAGGLYLLGDSIAKGMVKKFAANLSRNVPCWGMVFERIEDVALPRLAATTKPPPLSDEAVEAAKRLGFEAPVSKKDPA